jgi:hypothetical protein
MNILHSVSFSMQFLLLKSIGNWNTNEPEHMHTSLQQQEVSVLFMAHMQDMARYKISPRSRLSYGFYEPKNFPGGTELWES